ncbi:hypothetical protein [Streptomyces marianii]|uniref:Uncharacterized protein n=1 Tax=Streptomyces marianii TaxID=1817406 RepID=A0A5R9DTT9_9ACTN|nr:hypothetical protein [Streptomyces marianii]TLQ39181.1 hypothetical protein FEF34_37910 [Streptomyces marianii]
MAAQTTYVAVRDGRPTRAASTLAAAQDAALAAETEFLDAADWEFRWEETDPGSEWRLTHRYLPSGKTRFSRTARAVYAVDHITG